MCDRLQAACVPGLAQEATLHGDSMPAGYRVPPAMLDLRGLPPHAGALHAGRGGLTLCRAMAPMPGQLHHDSLDTCSAQQRPSLRPQQIPGAGQWQRTMCHQWPRHWPETDWYAG